MHSTERPNEPPTGSPMAQAFDSYCKKALKYAARDHFRERQKLYGREMPFTGLSKAERANLVSTDTYFADAHAFEVLGEQVNVSDSGLAEALNALPDDRRTIILMAYFFDMPDKEIAEHLNLARRTVAYKRTSSLQQLKKILESE